MLDLPTDVCQLSHIEHERPVLFHELIPGSLASLSSIENINKTLELTVVDGGSDVDSMPELEDETNLDFRFRFGRNPFVANTQWGYGNFPRRKGDL